MKKIIFIITTCCWMAANSYANIGDVLDNLQEQKITYRITVVDESGKPIPNATLWKVVNYAERPIDAGALMQRLVLRYAQDVDIITNVKLHPALLVNYTDQQGKFNLTVEAKAKEDKNAGHLRVSIAALKRGFLPSVIENEYALNSSHNITLRLQTDLQHPVPPELVEMDKIRGDIDASQKLGIQSPQRAEILNHSASQIRTLAEQTAQNNKPDIAAILYHQLAYMPSIKIFTNAQNQQTGISVMNGYDEKDAQRKLDYEHALQLNTSNPQLLYARMERRHQEAGDLNYQATDAMRQTFLKDAEGLRNSYGERLWPFDFQFEWKQYAEVSMYDKACAHLNEFYAFEPTYFRVTEWANESDFIKYIAKKHGDQYQCEIKELTTNGK